MYNNRHAEHTQTEQEYIYLFTHRTHTDTENVKRGWQKKLNVLVL